MEPIRVQYLGGIRTRTEQPNALGAIHTHSAADPQQPLEAYTPMQLVATAAAACVLSTIGHSAEAHGFSIEGAEALVNYTVHRRPTRLASLTIELIMDKQTYDSRQKRFIAAAAEACAVTRSLAPDVQKTLSIRYAD